MSKKQSDFKKYSYILLKIFLLHQKQKIVVNSWSMIDCEDIIPY